MATSTNRAKRKHYKCCRCKTFYLTPDLAETHLIAKHEGHGIIVFDKRGKK